jgi:hypothetical protein
MRRHFGREEDEGLRELRSVLAGIYLWKGIFQPVRIVQCSMRADWWVEGDGKKSLKGFGVVTG